MVKRLLLVRVAGPTMFLSAFLLLVCTVAAVLLYRYHAQAANSLTDDLDKRRVASEIETTLQNLVTLHQTSPREDNRNQIKALQTEVYNLLTEAHALGTWQRQGTLGEEFEASLQRYFTQWLLQPADGGPAPGSWELLRGETLPLAGRLRRSFGENIKQSEEALHDAVKWLAWGLVVIGCLGSVAGLLMGFSVASRLHRSMCQLSVQIHDAAGKLRKEIPGVTLTYHDGMEVLQDQVRGLVAEIEQVVAQLQQRNEDVMHAEQMAAVGRLATTLAHELRNPLTAVKMLIQTSREDMEGRGLPVEDMVVIEDEIRRLEKSLQAFLDLGRPSRMERRETDLCEIVEESLALVGGRARKQEVEVVFHPPEGGVVLEADPEQLRRLLVNLTLNALDAMPTGGRLTVAATADGPNAVRVDVLDTGPGIAPEVSSRLFQPFASTKETGLGLGLVISRRIAEEHGGSLTAVNRPEGGACFTLRLPVAAAARAAAGAAV